MEDVFYTSMGGLTLPFRLRFPENEAWFFKPDPALPVLSIPPIALSNEDVMYYTGLGFAVDVDPRMEASTLTANFSDALLAFDRVIVHAVALRWQERAWLICAPPGVGKSTQARFLQELRPGEFGVICGDRPVLQFCHSERSEAEPKNPRSSSPVGTVIAHPSPWNGKEGWHGAEAAPLAGLILLERGEENCLVAINEREAAPCLYRQLIHSALSVEMLRRIAELESRLLKAVPVCRLTSFEVPASTKLLLNTVFS